LITGLLLTTLSVACGGPDSDLTAEIQTTADQSAEALVGLVPLLDFSEVVDASMAERVLVDEIILNVSDLRLLGLDPSLPTGGLRLIDGSQLVYLSRETQDEISFAFPEHLEREDLAVYLNISPSAELGGASVIVRGRLYATTPPVPEEGRTRAFLAGSDEGEGAVDPDGEPATRDGEGAVDPDGEPASRDGEGAVDPDGEPADCAPDQRCQGLSAAEAATYVAFELQGEQNVELQVGFGPNEALEVVLGIPAARWFTPDAVAAMNDALLLLSGDTAGKVTNEESVNTPGPGPVVLRDDRMGQIGANQSGSSSNDRLPEGDYSLRAGGGLGPDGTRGW
jgi:hypothetical protein